MTPAGKALGGDNGSFYYFAVPGFPSLQVNPFSFAGTTGYSYRWRQRLLIHTTTTHHTSEKDRLSKGTTRGGLPHHVINSVRTKLSRERGNGTVPSDRLPYKDRLE